MNKYRWMVAVAALVLASLACQTVMGGGNDFPQVPDVSESTEVPDFPDAPEVTDVPQNPQEPEVPNNGGAQSGNGFPMPSDAKNVVEAQDTLIFETGMNVDEVIAFYRDEYGQLGLTERDSLTVVISGQLFTLVFDGDPSGKAISISGADTGSGTTAVTIVRQDF